MHGWPPYVSKGSIAPPRPSLNMKDTRKIP
jgi:hypothetical protein